MGDKDKDLHVQNQGTKIKDILKSIRGIIENHDLAKEESVPDVIYQPADPKYQKDREEEVLELTETLDSARSGEKESQVLSDDLKIGLLTKIERFIDKVEGNGYLVSDQPTQSIDDAALNIMKPLIKEWLDNNLPTLIERIISEEIKQLVPRKH